MRKEILLAIIVGIAAGLGITYGLYTVRERLDSSETAETIEESRLVVASPTPSPLSSLTLQQPEQDLLTNEETVQVIGRTIPNSHVIILAQEAELITTADQDGDFAQTVPLEPGGNRLTITTITPDGAQESTVRNVVYSTVDLTQETTSPSATDEAETQASPEENTSE